MQTRRDFLKNAASLTGTAFVAGTVPEAVARAMAIDPEHGSSFMDAEHVVILMQENRSFDHAFGALQGVRGYGDPRPHLQPNGNQVWFQTDKQGETYSPFRLDIRNTRVTWIGGLPHSWHDQVDAHHGGRYDQWLIAKPHGHLPFTLGYYTRKDIPFYYALADAFTICDQAFCACLTGTTPNRLFLWTGNLRKDASDFPRVLNEDTDYDREASWTTFPERLEDAGVSWKVYQNELSIYSGFEGEEDDWLGNFTDNPLEWFSQYSVRFSKTRRVHVEKRLPMLPGEIASGEEKLRLGGLTHEEEESLRKQIEDLKSELEVAKLEVANWTDEAWKALPTRRKALHERAFVVNHRDSDYRKLETIHYEEGGVKREVAVPRGDILHQFKRDVENHELPAVSWIVSPGNFSDHPSSAWYGAWYVSEVLNTLTKDPEIWKKTIFILCYDENDGYFDHIPPFVAPHPSKPETGKVSSGIDTTVDFAEVHERSNSIGLGFRVPLVVASPWSRGGCVNSQVFDHTSIIQLMEKWLEGKGKSIRESNISEWRRTVCGDLTSVFSRFDGSRLPFPKAFPRDPFVKQIHSAKLQPMPTGGQALSQEQIAALNVGVAQEPGTRRSCPLCYELNVNAVSNGQHLHLTFEAASDAFGNRSLGSPFNAYSYGEAFTMRSYAVKAGDTLTDSFVIASGYHIRIDGPNGFMREFKGGGDQPSLCVNLQQAAGASAKLTLKLKNETTIPQKVEVKDESYGARQTRHTVAPGQEFSLEIPTHAGKGWYDLRVLSAGQSFRFAGRVETGRWGLTDPSMAVERVPSVVDLGE